MPGAPHLYEAGLFQLRQLHRDAALAHPQNLLQLGYTQFFLVQQPQNTDAAFVAQQP